MPNPFRRSSNPYRRTPEGEPLEGSGFSRPLVRIVVPIIMGVIIISVIAVSSVRTVSQECIGVFHHRLLSLGRVTVSLSQQVLT